MIKAKTIKSMGKSFLFRISLYVKSGSIKLHIISNDDNGDLHTHPWNFTSFLIIPYKEEFEDALLKHKAFSKIYRQHDWKHRVKLYRIFGVKIPAITIGKYSQKFTLCSYCKELGYCKESKVNRKIHR